MPTAPTSLAFVSAVLFFLSNPFRPVRVIQGMGCGMGGGTVVLGEMDVAWVNPYRSGQGERPLRLPVTHPTGQQRPPNSRGGGLEVSLLPGGRRPLGPDDIGRWGMEDDVWRGQKEGSVES